MVIPRPVHSFWFWLLLILQIFWTTPWEQQKQHGNYHSFSPSSGYALQEISLPDVFVLDHVAKPGFDMEQKCTADIHMLAGKSSLEMNFAWMCIKQISQLKVSNNPEILQNLHLGRGGLSSSLTSMWVFSLCSVTTTKKPHRIHNIFHTPGT